mmetsp:Transcript_95826/g.271154  ORF Transcript_95826/g.271154 Transcript_95826/m.271154 type:complete len:207 (-) Transcript_95826:829-1449(-)
MCRSVLAERSPCGRALALVTCLQRKRRSPRLKAPTTGTALAAWSISWMEGALCTCCGRGLPASCGHSLWDVALTRPRRQAPSPCPQGLSHCQGLGHRATADLPRSHGPCSRWTPVVVGNGLAAEEVLCRRRTFAPTWRAQPWARTSCAGRDTCATAFCLRCAVSAAAVTTRMRAGRPCSCPRRSRRARRCGPSVIWASCHWAWSSS